jgi:acetolactate synthase I/II/III large subunit
MKTSDYIADYLVKKKIKKVFSITGGASIHIIHSLAENPKIDYVCMHHEQGCSMAADGYSRVSDHPGVALATSGPGATNLITGIACSWFDSIPSIFITGQVTRFRMRGNLNVRQIGFQETDIISMVKTITKYSTQILNVENLKKELDKCFYFANEGRPGPVLIDIPDDIQRQELDSNLLKSLNKNKFFISKKLKLNKNLKNKINKLQDLINRSKRPVIIPGNGIRLSKSLNNFLKFQKLFKLPFAPTWATLDLFQSNDKYNAGPFGTHGLRCGNFTVQNSDLIISIGSRLGTRETGSPLSSFGREAKLVVVDIDNNEIKKFDKFNKKVDLAINSDVKVFLDEFNKNIKKIDIKDYNSWIKQISIWKKKYKPGNGRVLTKKVNPYLFLSKLNQYLSKDEIILSDTGSAIAWITQSFKFNSKQRLIHDFNNTAMGYALPASIGAKLADKNSNVTCLVGDGSFMMNIQELSTLTEYNIPIKIILLNNEGYSMVKQTQDQWLGGKYFATSQNQGLSFPSFKKIASSFDLDYLKIQNDNEINKLKNLKSIKKSILIEILIDEKERVLPQSRFGYPIEDADPLLDRNEFLNNMIVKPYKI